MGDMVITLPYLLALRNSLPPSTKLDLLTRKEVSNIPASLYLFNKVYTIGGARNFKKQYLYTLLLMPLLWLKGYDIVIDLQNNLISTTVLKLLHPKAWSVFDKVSPLAAGERTRLTIAAIGIDVIESNHRFMFKKNINIKDILIEGGWTEQSELIVINPAGAFETRNWPVENYASFIQLWLNKFPNTQFVMMGVSLIAEKQAYLKKIFGNRLIALVNKTKPAEAFAILQQVSLVLTEDSGLMHMSWVSGIPTVAMFGSTRSDWSRPLGTNSLLLDSNDLPCGNCQLELCLYKDVHCLSRYTPTFVFNKCVALFERCSLLVK
jgi:ADP-heptose:LPS heptosyltransferase